MAGAASQRCVVFMIHGRSVQDDRSGVLALWTGQRQGDLLTLPWSAYDGSHIRLRQFKTGQAVVVRVGAPLKKLLDRTKKRSTVILTNTRGRPWTSDGFRTSWRKMCRKAGIEGLTFHDLRGSAVTRRSRVPPVASTGPNHRFHVARMSHAQAACHRGH